MSTPPAATCSCSHPVDCNHDCHGRHCDPSEHVCSIEFLPDDGGLAAWGCAACTPGVGLPHAAGCPAEGMMPSLHTWEPPPAEPRVV